MDDPDDWIVPPWPEDAELWQRAFAVPAVAEPPAYRGVFLHRDFHLGNVLWSGGDISGVVDWVETSWGPAHQDARARFDVPGDAPRGRRRGCLRRRLLRGS